MTTWTVEPLRTATSRGARMLELARRRAEDELAGRTVWCVAALPAGREPAWALRASLHLREDSGVAVSCLELFASEPLAELAERLEAMLRGADAARDRLSEADDGTYAGACLEGDTLLGDAVMPEDVVVLHDALAAVTADAARERGAHVAWRIDASSASQPGAAAAAWDFMRPYTRGIGGYVGAWPAPREHGGRIGSALPATGALSGWDVGSGEMPVGWSSALAALVHDDRHETVGGTIHARPAVAVR